MVGVNSQIVDLNKYMGYMSTNCRPKPCSQRICLGVWRGGKAKILG